MYDIHTRAHLVYRDKTEISRLDNDALIVNDVTAGALHSEQDGRAVDLLPGDGAVSDAARPYFFGFDHPLGCVSVKDINRLFEAEGTSLARHIWHRRLECCALRLRDLAWAHVATSTVAFEHGFSDSSHVSRTFRRRYGMSPRDWRAAGG